MKVKELLDQLKELDPEMEVITEYSNRKHYPIVRISKGWQKVYLETEKEIGLGQLHEDSVVLVS